MQLQDVDWQNWQPGLQATLLFVVRDHEILLIHKKRGLGAGKINGPGGKVDPGETPQAGAIREVEEELGATPLDVAKAGEVWFQVTDGTSIRIHVFSAGGLSTEAVETDEAIPLWTALDEIPYDRMWQDDRIWLPMLLEGRYFCLQTLFEDDRLIGFQHA